MQEIQFFAFSKIKIINMKNLYRHTAALLFLVLFSSCVGQVHTYYDKTFIENESGEIVSAHGTKLALPGDGSAVTLRLVSEWEGLYFYDTSIPEWLSVNVVGCEQFDKTRFVSTVEFRSVEKTGISRSAKVISAYQYRNDMCLAELLITQEPKK